MFFVRIYYLISNFFSVNSYLYRDKIIVIYYLKEDKSLDISGIIFKLKHESTARGTSSNRRAGFQAHHRGTVLPTRGANGTDGEEKQNSVAIVNLIKCFTFSSLKTCHSFMKNIHFPYVPEQKTPVIIYFANNAISDWNKF